jgi:broad specificity phosphatase PhoE
MLKDSGVSAIYATDTERARDTAGPLAAALGKPVQIYDELAPLVARLRKENAKELVLVVGHSNTMPDLLKALGDAETVTIASNQYDDLFVVVPKGDGKPAVLRLRY